MSDLLTMSSFGGFPKSFLSSLKVLFDILDDRGTGYVKLADIEERWRDDGSVDSLPPGVTTALRKVAPPDGKLTFEIFVAGLRIALLHDRSEPEPRHSDHDVKVGRKEPIPPPYHAKTPTVNSAGHKSGTLNNVPLMTKQRAFSMPQLDGKLSYPQNGHGDNTGGTRCESTSSTDQQYFRSLKQQATNRPSGAGHSSNKNGGEPDMLTRWQQQLKSGDQEKRWSEKQSNFRKPGDGKSSTSSSSALEQYSGVAGDVAQAKGRGNPAPPGSQRTVKRRDSRRHTLANGVDFNMIKRMKQLERERDVLLQGLEMVDRARTWYQKQLCSVQEKQRSAAAQNDQSLEAHQERISLQMARIFEVNQQLKALVDSSEKGLPFHMNLAVSGPGRPHQNSLNHATELKEKDTTIGRLKSQNRMLTQEVSATSEKVTQLEQEKRQLIRELFEARAHKHNSESKTHSYDDTTFI